MLILSRKKGEAIQIGDGIEIRVVSIQGDQVKIGIDAPKSVEVFRKEIYDQIQEENKQAVIASPILIDLIAKSKNK
jgi:carbon storage regulator